MKKVRLILASSNDDGYQEVSSNEKYEKWIFPSNPVLECVIMERASLPQKKGGGTYDLYTVMQKDTKKPFVFFCGKVLEDKLKKVPLHSLVRIKFEGKHATKDYYLFSVSINTNFKYDPSIYNLDSYSEVSSSEPEAPFSTQQQQQSVNPQANRPASKPFDVASDDLPF